MSDTKHFTIKFLDGNTAWKGEATSIVDAINIALRSYFDLRRLYEIDFSTLDLAGIPVIPDIDAAILRAISHPRRRLNMESWHSCDTTHCRAGWAVHLAGNAGYDLEQKFKGFGVAPGIAGALIYAASRPGQPIPDFYADTNETITDLYACAGIAEEA